MTGIDSMRCSSQIYHIFLLMTAQKKTAGGNGGLRGIAAGSWSLFFLTTIPDHE